MTVTGRRRLTARLLRTHPGPSALLAALSFLLSAVAVSVPIVLSALVDATAREAVAALAPGARDLEAAALGLPSVGAGAADLEGDLDAVWGRWQSRLADIRDGLDEPLASLVGEPSSVSRISMRADGAGVALSGGDGRNSVVLALDPRYTENAVLVGGAWPEPTATDDAADADAPPMQVALSEETARALEWDIGEVQSDPVAAVSLVLTGTFEARAGSEEHWYHVPSVLVPQVEYAAGSGDRIVTGTGFLAPEMLASWAGSTGRTQVWFPLHASAMDAADAGAVLQQLRQLTAHAHRVGTQEEGIGSVLTLSFRTTAIDAIEGAVASAGAMSAVIALTLSAPAGVAVAVVALACRVVARTRRASLGLLATRGASPLLLRGMLAAHGVVLGLLPALLAAATIVAIAAVARLPVPTPTWIGAGVVAVLPAIILGLTPLPPPGLRDLERAPSRARATLRVAAEGVVVALAVIATAALLSSSSADAAVGSSASETGGEAVLPAIVPLLWGLAGCVLALRLVPLPVRMLFARARRGRGLVGFVGGARALREPAAGIAPVLALVIGMSSAVGSGVLYGSLQHEIESTARLTVGADLQVTRADLSTETLAELRAVPGIEALAPIAVMPASSLRAGAGASVDVAVVTVLFADPADLAAAQDADFALLPAGADLESPGDEVPVVLSARASAAIDGEEEVRLEGAQAVVVDVSRAGGLESVSANWALAAAADVEQIAGLRVPASSAALFRLSPGADVAAVAAAVAEIVGPDAVVTTPGERIAALSGQTGTAAIRVGLLAATVGVALLGALTVVLTLALGSRGRDRTLALLRVLGAPPRVSRGLIAWELWPGAASAVVIGVGVGLALPALILGAVDLRAFTGAPSNPAYHLDPLLLGGAVVGFAVVTAAFTLIALAVSRRVRATTLLRGGQEG
ncbi:FtsX-like permease family protein [Microbacterium saccharophilum]|uniref:FtsX-like permease family protein n=1 Tax=Microbacterium saccharophilum TaxID=1213358 RepID=A0A5C8I819_9MICO|nr:FtsX-like permease family protein [Microbacterium saccharophilum]TXK14938.1 FtsX-like permease family protein [Microbacterium saccharophilum]GEP47333.1 hypothetical protein MSA03_08410 [Microbacterium saccharophilum]